MVHSFFGVVRFSALSFTGRGDSFLKRQYILTEDFERVKGPETRAGAGDSEGYCLVIR
jgi:hypothetical protein